LKGQAQAKLEADTEKLWSVNEMERTGGEPDVVVHDKQTGEYNWTSGFLRCPKAQRTGREPIKTLFNDRRQPSSS
jgi:hypothetical protein